MRAAYHVIISRARIVQEKNPPPSSTLGLLPPQPRRIRTLENWDLECARKHLDAIKDSVVSHDELQSFILMKDERPMDTLDLAGLEDAPGVYNTLTQRCRLVFTNQNRLVFTQVRRQQNTYRVGG